MAVVLAKLGTRNIWTGPDVTREGTENEFETRLEDILNLIEDGLLTNEMVCRILKQLTAMSGHSQIRSLWTALQPLLHRDFMFTGQRNDVSLHPISTVLSRDTRFRLTKTKNTSRYHRARSAYLTDEGDVFQLNRLPPITKGGRVDDLIDNSNAQPESIGRSHAHFPEIPQALTSQPKRVKIAKGKDTSKIRKRLKIMGDRKSKEIQEKVQKLFVWFEKWTNPEKAIFFQRILPKLESKQLYFLSTYLSVRQHCDIISKLPVHCSLKILSYLSPKELARSAAVSKTWNELCLSGSLWREKCDHLRGEMATPSISSARSARFYEIYRGDQIRQRNWSRADSFHSHFVGHDSRVLSVAFNRKILVSGSADATVRVWSIRNGSTIRVLSGHSKGVWCVAIFTEILIISGSYDQSVKIWNIGSGECLRTLFGHTGPVWALSCQRNMAATASHDTTVKLWNMSRCRVLHTLTGHSKPVFSVDLSEDASLVFSGGADHSVRIWDASLGQSLKVIWTCNAAPVMSVSHSQGLLAFSAHKLLFVWDIEGGKYVKNFRGHKCRIETIKLSAKKGGKEISLLSAGKDGKLKHWRFGQSKPVNTVVAHKGCQINCVAFDKKRLVTALYDNSICVCDFTMAKEVDKHSQV